MRSLSKIEPLKYSHFSPSLTSDTTTLTYIYSFTSTRSSSTSLIHPHQHLHSLSPNPNPPFQSSTTQPIKLVRHVKAHHCYHRRVFFLYDTTDNMPINSHSLSHYPWVHLFLPSYSLVMSHVAMQTTLTHANFFSLNSLL